MSHCCAVESHLVAAGADKLPLLGLGLSQGIPRCDVRPVAQVLERCVACMLALVHGEVVEAAPALACVSHRLSVLVLVALLAGIAAGAHGGAECVSVVREQPADVADEGFVGHEHQLDVDARWVAIRAELARVAVGVETANVREEVGEPSVEYSIILRFTALLVENPVDNIVTTLREKISRPRKMSDTHT